MAKRGEEEEDDLKSDASGEDERETDSDDDARDESDADESADETGSDTDSDESDENSDESDENSDDSDESEADEDALATSGAEDSLAARDGEDGEDDPEGVVATQLGAQRWVLTASFGAAALAGYLVAMSIHGIWAYLGTRDFFALRFPAVAGIHDDTKLVYSLLVGGVIGVGLLTRGLKNRVWRQWADDVAGELVKVKWPARKEVTSGTIVVLATSAISTGYLFVLDRLWGFVTNLIYGTGS